MHTAHCTACDVSFGEESFSFLLVMEEFKRLKMKIENSLSLLRKNLTGWGNTGAKISCFPAFNAQLRV
jgi:hypothetical protein